MIAVKTVRTSHVGPWRIAGWGLVAGLLLSPAVAMRFTDAVVWTASDFALAALLLVGAGLTIELALWRARGMVTRIALCVAVLAVVGLIWAEGAVGLFR